MIPVQRILRQSLLSLLVLTTSFAPLLSQTDSDDEICQPSMITTYVIGGITLLSTVVVHEFGHFTTAHLLGANNVVMDFTPFKYGPTSLAVTLVDTAGLSSADMAIISMSGVGITRLLAEGADLYSKRWRGDSGCPNFGERLVSAVHIAGRLDYPQYVLTSIVLEVQGGDPGDMGIFVSKVFGERTLDRIFGYTTLAAVGAVDLILDYKRLLYHVGVASGSERLERLNRSNGSMGIQEGPVFDVRPFVQVEQGSLGIAVRGSW